MAGNGTQGSPPALDLYNTDMTLWLIPAPTWPPISPNTDWSQLNPYKRHSFQFNPETTPLGNLSAILTVWVLYHTVIWTLQWLFRTRERWPARAAAAIHNLFLCFFSAWMCLGILNDTVFKIEREGWRAAVCAADLKEVHGAVWYWCYIYYISKYPELIDTILLAVKKRSMSFLHVYHHTIVILMVWVWFPTGISLGSFGVIANTGIHILMYFHYFMTSIGHQIKWLKIFVTRAQILQFVWSFIGSLPYLYYALGYGAYPPHINLQQSGGWGCLGKGAFLFGSVINATFLYLFVDFYSRTYNAKSESKTKQA